MKVLFFLCLCVTFMVATTYAAPDRIDTHECNQGPRYWCQSEEIQKKCVIPAEYCEKLMQNESIKVSDEPKVRVRLDDKKCNRGPSYWCQSEEIRKKCDITAEYCERLKSKSSS